MQNIREKLRRKLSLHDKNPDFNDYHDPEDLDDETHRHANREYAHAEESNEPYGKQGSFLNKLIMSGNKKTEEEIHREQAAGVGTAGTSTSTTAGLRENMQSSGTTGNSTLGGSTTMRDGDMAYRNDPKIPQQGEQRLQ
ncbi:hypothetical protein LTR78_002170 [Recurvomyces mirabilis]|uniref:Uncharacterized protein n=1 Tax=Recurvomyces mirabilis TaxID=574656 RepID=A0AAE0WUK9_9PEZI|nr:hypothetical protein LTR78_002170 [Recurvomyces mirabilis]KAK5160627.1 hypothetical protein LTS14_001639 [Recurvomyces mirabilis]